MRLVRKMVAPTIWIILASFLFFGTENLIIGLKKESNAAGKVFGKSVSWKEFNDAMRSAEFFFQSLEKPKTSEEVEIIAWQNIALEREANRAGIKVTDDEVRAEIEKFFGGQIPDHNAYAKWTEQVLRESPRDFEERVRKIVKIQKLTAQNAPTEVAAEKKETRPTEPSAQDQKYMEWWNDVMKRAAIERFNAAA